MPTLQLFLLPSLLLAVIDRGALANLSSKDNPWSYSANITAQCVEACYSLFNAQSDLVIYSNTSESASEQSGFWSTFQADVSPVCFVTPSSTQDVSHILSVARAHACPFAVRSGGHAAFAGASNIEDGITIDLRMLNEVTISDDRKTTRVGAGNRWIDVYDTLTPRNLSVVGGRVAEIGVGGLTLGGGISFFSGRRGFACDNVRNYELVDADGQILEVNHASHPDLYWALRGGGNNFGIVTRFDLETFEQGQMWGGPVYHSIAANRSLIHALHDLSHADPQDPDTATWVAIAWSEAGGGWIGSTELTNTHPIANPPSLSTFAEIPHLADLTAVTNLTTLARDLNQSNPNGLRETYWARSFKMDITLLEYVVDTFIVDMAPILDVTGIIPALVLQPITKATASHFSKNGGNALGLNEAEMPLLVLSVATMWADTSADAAVLAAVESYMAKIIAWANERELGHRYIYQNYASKAQGKDGLVFASYGEKNLERLREVSKKYDPDGVFQTLQPGYHKLW